MTLANTRSVLVDDLDPTGSIQYTGGPWFEDTDATDSPGIYGHSLFGTLHGTNRSAAITFAFHGTKIMPAGAFRNMTEGAVFPTWTCLIDGVNSSPNPFRIPIHRWPLCEDDTLPDGQHNVTLNIQVPDGQQFWFDYMQYAPSESVPLDNANVYVDNTDPDVTFGGDWPIYLHGQEASTSGSSLKLNFHGTSVIWVGIIPSNSTSNASTMSYSIDGASAGTAYVPGSPFTTSPVIFNQHLFQTPPLPNGKHVLEVVYNGNAPQSAPLVIDNFIVLNRTSNILSTAAGVGGASDAPRNGLLSHFHDIGVIIGIVAGGCLVLIGLTVFIFIVCRRRRYNSRYNRAFKYTKQGVLEDGRG